MVEARLRVIYGDTDQMGVVYYANYFRYFEFARSEYFRAKGGSYATLEKEGSFLPVVEASCTYKAPAKYDDVLLIRTEVSELKRASLAFSYEIRREGDGQLLCTGRTIHACVGKDGRPMRLPEAVTRLFNSEPGQNPRKKDT
ncbi:MAG: acyl-CoA thioesterase [Myxococcaceae bacterium]|nr:acyl-CoA thioesterase [Myxococcaceae bacterium]